MRWSVTERPHSEPGLLAVHRYCNHCGKPLRGRYGQRSCTAECRLAGNASEARAQRMLWRQAGKPSEEQLQNEKL